MTLAVTHKFPRRGYIKDRIRVAKDGYVDAPTKPGLGYEINRDVLDRMTKRVETSKSA